MTATATAAALRHSFDHHGDCAACHADQAREEAAMDATFECEEDWQSFLAAHGE